MTTDISKRETRRQRRITRRKQEILDAAARVFAEKGYANATTREIAEAADLAEGTLYNYYGGKREILLAILNQTQTLVDTMFEQAGTLETREDAVALIEQGYTLLLNALPFVRTLIAEAWLDNTILEVVLAGIQRLSDRVQHFVELRIHAGQFRPVDPSLATRIVLAMFIIPILPVLRGVQPLPSLQERHELAQNVIDLFIDGVRARQEG